MFFVGFCIWLCFGVAGAMLASSRGHNGCAGMVLGFLLGPIGLIIIACMKVPEAVRARNAMVEAGPEIICQFCRSTIPAAATVCRFCQRQIR